MLAQSLMPPSQPSIPYFHPPNTTSVPSGDIWDNQTSYSADTMDIVSWSYYTLPPSPPASVSSNADDSPLLGRKKTRPRFTPELQSENEQQPCLPTNQMFDLDSVERPSSSSSASTPPSIPCQLALSSDSGAQPKKLFAAIGVKKGRGSGERVTTKDFVPPDVTGLSKREARLLKNRAAAFLSRQRKREEFEAMEIRLRELEEENARLQALAAKGKEHDDLVANLEQLRGRLSMAEKREQALSVELANQTATNLAVKSESHDPSLPRSPYSPRAASGPASIITVMKQSLISLLPSLFSLPPQTLLPIDFTVPLIGKGSGSSLSTSLGYQAASCDIKDQGRPRFGHGNIECHPNSADAEPPKNIAFGGGALETCQSDMGSLHCSRSLAISFDASPTEDGRGCVHIQVSERHAKPAMQSGRQEPPSLASQWPGADLSFGMTYYASPPSSAPVGVPSPNSMDHLGMFADTGGVHSRLSFDGQLMQSGYTPFGHYDPEQTFDYYPGMIPE